MKKNKRGMWMVTLVVLAMGLIVGFIAFVLLKLPGTENDDWVKDEKGIYVRHGMPISKPNYVINQENAIFQAKALYNIKKSEGMNFSSQCLGTVMNDYVVDIVHVPRNSEDDLQENQCAEFKIGKIKNFIELDSSGEIVMVFEED